MFGNPARAPDLAGSADPPNSAHDEGPVNNISIKNSQVRREEGIVPKLRVTSVNLKCFSPNFEITLQKYFK